MWDLQDINWDFKKLLLLCQYQSPWNDTGILMPIPIHQGKTNPQHSIGYEYQLISDSFPHACFLMGKWSTKRDD